MVHTISHSSCFHRREDLSTPPPRKAMREEPAQLLSVRYSILGAPHKVYQMIGDLGGQTWLAKL